MKAPNILNLTEADRASIARWRRTMMVAVAVMVAVTLIGPNLYRTHAQFMGMTYASARSKAARPSLECATRDGQYLMKLEEEGNRPGAAGDKLYRAFLTMLDARTLCNASRQKDAFALYDQAFGSSAASTNLVTKGTSADQSARD